MTKGWVQQNMKGPIEPPSDTLSRCFFDQDNDKNMIKHSLST